MSEAPLIYHIQTPKGHYIGKKSDEKYLDYHIKHAAPEFMQFVESEKAVTWEKEWRDQIERYGLQWTLNNYITFSQSRVSKDIQKLLLDRFEPLLNSDKWSFFKNKWSKEAVWENIKRIWKPISTPDLSVTEALLIILASKKEQLINKKIDFMGHKTFQENPYDLFTNKEYNRKMTVLQKELTPTLFFGIKGEKSQKITILTYLQKKRDAKNKVLWKIKQRIEEAIQEEQEKYSKDDVWYSIYETLISKVQNTKRFDQLDKLLNDYFSGNQSVASVNLTKQIQDISISSFLLFLRLWRNITIFDWSWITSSIDDRKDDEQIKDYRNKFTKIMQDSINKNNPFMKNSKRVQKEEISSISKYRQWKANVKKEWEPTSNFIKDNLDAIWREQIKIYYNNEKKATIY